MRAIYGGAGLVAVLPVVSSASRLNAPRNSVAIQKPGAPSRGGNVWMLHAGVYRVDTAAMRAGDIACALGSPQVRQYDPVGNLQKTGE